MASSPRLVPAWFIAIAILACGPEMPSTVPLGRGPLAGPVARPARSAHRARTRSSAHRVASSAESSGDTSEPESDETEEHEVAEADESTDAAEADASAGALDDVAGDYAGHDVTRYLMDGAPERVEKDPNAKTRVATRDEGFSFSLVDSSNGNDICTLTGRKGADNRIAIDPDQECFSQDASPASTKGTVRKGTARFSDAKLVLELELDFEISVNNQTVSGSLMYRFDGERQ